MVFLSLGSNYTFKKAWNHLLSRGTQQDSDALQAALTKRYKGKKSLLFARGRGALAAAIRLATGGRGGVAVTSLTCYVVIEAIKTAGCQPVYVDIDPLTLHFDARNLAHAIKNNDIRAVIIQNTLGIPVNINDILRVTQHFSVPVIEDLAHAVGGRYADGREIGTVGDFTMLSFGRDKMLDTINGGALIIRTEKVQAVVSPPTEVLRRRRQVIDKIYPLIGWLARRTWNSGFGKYVLSGAYKLKLAVRSADGGTMMGVKMPHWQAKLALRQVEQLDKLVMNRLEKQTIYLKELALFSPAPSSNAVRLPILVNNRSHVTRMLRESGIYVEDPWYDVPVIPERLMSKSDFPFEHCPTAVDVAKHLMNLPTHQAVTKEEMTKIISIVRSEAQPWK